LLAYFGTFRLLAEVSTPFVNFRLVTLAIASLKSFQYPAFNHSGSMVVMAKA